MKIFTGVFLLCATSVQADGVISTLAFRNGNIVTTAPEFNNSTVIKSGINGAMELFRNDIADNTPKSGSVSETLIDGSNGQAYASYAVNGVVRSVGDIGTWGVHDITGGNFRAILDNNGWAAAVHADCVIRAVGGTCVGLNIEFPQTTPGSLAVGINIQPEINARNLVGLQFQNPLTYKYGIIAQNMNYIFGQVDAVPFGFRFNSMTQKLEFFRDIGQPGEVRRGYINMNFEAPDSQLNK
jgi:hypothetical protein